MAPILVYFLLVSFIGYGSCGNSARNECACTDDIALTVQFGIRAVAMVAYCINCRVSCLKKNKGMWNPLTPIATFYLNISHDTLLKNIDADMKSEIGSLRPNPLRFHVEKAGADAKLNQQGPLGVAYHRRHPISTVLVAKITAHATVSG